MIKHNPLIVTLPRTGSTYITKLLYNIAHNLYGSKNYLNQFITITPHYKERFDKVDGIVQSVEYKREKNGFHDQYKERESIITRRLGLLKDDVKYTTKIFAQDFTPASFDFFSKNFDFIFLERRNRMEQLLSFSTMMETNVFEYTKSDTISKSHFDFNNCILFFGLLIAYQKIKKLIPNPTVIYYEDFMEKGGDTSALMDLLSIPRQSIPTVLPISTIPTPTKNYEDLLDNREAWLSHKNTILKLLDEIHF